ncbi:5-formyltetrahydrofolate cyclo-ligase [Austwickia sp. TVS 96-490-7B]|uniref:5-formyltetrahydrofolate cyclo-ligase n=1 Tax=Austwickia sp. TVS 96-490-7B TaxID=2830843 RepID=UPI001C59EA45|nr:5-formyltetrahydrofolate cyclo-ligase [Austwickia sp. TVS 96-490-7B]
MSDERDTADSLAVDIMDAKRVARREVRSQRRVRAALPPDSPARLQEAQAVAETMAQLVQALQDAGRVRRVETVTSYVSMPGEPPTTALHERWHAAGVRIMVPVVLPDLDLEWTWWPAEEVDPPLLGVGAIADADMVMVPALRIDRRGMRLGQGGGCYDRALTRRSPDAPVIALVDDDALVDEVPTDAHDLPVQAVVRPTAGWTFLPEQAAVCQNK